MKRRSTAMTLAVLALLILAGVLALTREDESGGAGIEAATHLIAPGAATEGPSDGADTEEAEETEPAKEETALAASPAPTERAAARREENDEDGYFDDAVFVGDEQIMTLERYDYDGLLKNAVFLETENISDTGWLSELESGTVGKVYLGVGAVQLDYRDDVIRRGIEDGIDGVRRDQPGCVIYIMGVPPVSAYRSSTDSTINKDRAQYINTILQQIAAEKGARYLDVFSALCDDDGYLPSEVTVNGVDFTPGQYEGWYELLASKAVAGEDGRS